MGSGVARFTCFGQPAGEGGRQVHARSLAWAIDVHSHSVLRGLLLIRPCAGRPCKASLAARSRVLRLQASSAGTRSTLRALASQPLRAHQATATNGRAQWLVLSAGGRAGGAASSSRCRRAQPHPVSTRRGSGGGGTDTRAAASDPASTPWPVQRHGNQLGGASSTAAQVRLLRWAPAMKPSARAGRSQRLDPLRLCSCTRRHLGAEHAF